MTTDSTNFRHRKQEITPKMASAMLKRTEMLKIKNRKVSLKWVNRYAEDMKAGKWLPNGTTIIIDREGGVIDGQHRLMACVQSGVPFTTLVVEGVDRSTFGTIDCGRSRSAAQVLNIEGIKYYSSISSIIRGVAALRNKTYSNQKLVELSNTDVLEEYRLHSDLYDRIAETIMPSVQTTKMLSPKIAGSVFFYLVNDLGYDWDTVENFIMGCLSEESNPDEYVNAIRRWLFRNVKTKMHERIKLGNIARAWNAMVNNAKVPKFSDRIDEVKDFIQV